MPSRTPEAGPGRPPVRLADRLGSTLFLAALAHGVVILGVTFTWLPAVETDAIPSLHVTLVVDTDEAESEPVESELLADTSRQGGGRAAEGDRPTTTFAPGDPFAQPGDLAAADLNDARPREQAPVAEQIVSRGPSAERVAALPNGEETPASTAQKAAALIDASDRPTLAMEIDTRAEMPRSDDEAEIAAPTTEESILAAYLDGWRRRVERIGTVNFPARFRSGEGFGRPTLEVAIAADGDIADIVVRRSSGNSALDQAALDILRLAAPFEPLPDKIKAKYDVLRFAYEWDFSAGDEAAEAGETGSL